MDNLKNVTCLSVFTDNDLVKDHFKENPECCHSLVRCQEKGSFSSHGLKQNQGGSFRPNLMAANLDFITLIKQKNYHFDAQISIFSLAYGINWLNDKELVHQDEHRNHIYLKFKIKNIS